LQNLAVQIKPMCICLAETHITEDILEIEKCLDEYTLIEVTSHSRHTGGCCIYVRKDIKVLKISTPETHQQVWVLGVRVQFIKMLQTST
jgi:hypothetical protein